MSKQNKKSDLIALAKLAKKKLSEIKSKKDQKNAEGFLDELENIK